MNKRGKLGRDIVLARTRSRKTTMAASALLAARADAVFDIGRYRLNSLSLGYARGRAASAIARNTARWDALG